MYYPSLLWVIIINIIIIIIIIGGFLGCFFFYNSGMYATAYTLFYILYLNMTIISNKSYD